ncbi:enoyl-CoA hydratase [uncultured Sneathiella sp.]|uniref:enoyl-CoA hydratase n=1 Tax=uncultured Sneathiella sp. TaxID=879315 RepID=UPI0030EC93FD
MSDVLLETIEDGVATLTMNRPEARNAFTREMISGMSEKLTRLAKDNAVRVVVLTGAGGAFCSGGDVKSFAANAGAKVNLNEKIQDLRERSEVSRLLHEMPKPTLAVIPGPAAGAGFSLAMACDMRIAADDAKITTAFSKVGLSGDFGGSYFLTKLLGEAKAKELYFTADVVLGKEAEKIGMVNKSVPADELPAAAAEMAKRLASLPTIAVGYMKKNINTASEGTLSDVLDWEANQMIRSFETEDHKGAAVAFVEKRAPEFKGR